MDGTGVDDGFVPFTHAPKEERKPSYRITLSKLKLCHMNNALTEEMNINPAQRQFREKRAPAYESNLNSVRYIGRMTLLAYG